MMEYSLEQLHAKVENLTAAVLATVARETLMREIVDIERNQILSELNEVQKLISTKDTGTIRKQAEKLGLVMVEPNRVNGQYSGMVVGQDTSANLVKINRTSVLELPFAALVEGEDHPRFGDVVRIGFKEGVMSVRVTERSRRRAVPEQT